jgi:hypothetical protein
MAASFIVSLFLQLVLKMDNNDPRDFAWIVIITVSCSSVAWLLATFLTAPENMDVLVSFYRRVRPSASLWGPVAGRAPDVEPQRDGLHNLLDWLAGCVLVYMTLFGVGKLIFGDISVGLLFLALAFVAGWIVYRDLNRRGWKTVME